MGYKVKKIYKWVNGVEKQIYPAGWKPGANTIAYFPLKDDILDTQGNLSITHGTMSKATVGWNVSGGAKVTTTGAVYFMCGWCNIQSTPNAYICVCTGDNPEMGYYYSHTDSRFAGKVFVSYDSSFSTYSQSVSISTGTWHHYAISYENSKTNIYIDGVKKLEYSGIGYSFGNMVYLFSSWQTGTPNTGTSTAIISDYILESVGWTAEQVSNYYNQTKSNYSL